jgi:hypothetical protein
MKKKASKHTFAGILIGQSRDSQVVTPERESAAWLISRLLVAPWRSAEMLFGWTANERAPFGLLDAATVAGARHDAFTHHPKERVRNHTDGAPINPSNAL